MSDDKVDDILRVVGAFDWITPITRSISGWNTVEYEGSSEGAIGKQLELKSKGIKTKLEGNVFTGNWRVYSRKSK